MQGRDREAQVRAELPQIMPIVSSLAGQPDRWLTLIHEALHTVSTGYVRKDFSALPGWEEDIVEHLQRLFRPAILLHLCNPYTEMLEKFATRFRSLRYNSTKDYWQRRLQTVPLRFSSRFSPCQAKPDATR